MFMNVNKKCSCQVSYSESSVTTFKDLNVYKIFFFCKFCLIKRQRVEKARRFGLRQTGAERTNSRNMLTAASRRCSVTSPEDKQGSVSFSSDEAKWKKKKQQSVNRKKNQEKENVDSNSDEKTRNPEAVMFIFRVFFVCCFSVFFCVFLVK